MNEFAKEVDRALRELEDRFLRLSQQKSEMNKNDTFRIESQLANLNGKIQLIQEQHFSRRDSVTSFANERSKIV